ncbi:MAG: site-specific integrase [Bradyrhizobiaceae bacterium]|nr:site-specific integrase [Bradyrhizobiaceae bacterium]
MAHHRLMGGRLHLYKRENSRFWQCATFLAGTNHRESTKEESLEQAKDFAEDWYLKLKGAHRAGELKEGKLFKVAAQQFRREYEVITEGQRNKDYVKGHWLRLDNHLLPFFGSMRLSEVTPGKVQDYRIHRFEQAKAERGKPPARNTMHQEMVTLRQVLKTAYRHGWIKHVPDLSEPYKTNQKISHRAWFSPEEYKKLYTATRARAKQPKRNRWKWESEQLHDYVLFMVNTGLRPDEVMRIEDRDVKITHDEATDQKILEIAVRGKRGVGYCKSMPGAVVPYQRLKRRNGLQPKDKLFPKFPRELFKTILTELDLRFDREGNRRTAYSLRHTYISMRLMEGADIYQIAKNCRTSVEMIQKYYASHIANTLDAAAINVMRPKPKDKKRVEDARRGELVE